MEAVQSLATASLLIPTVVLGWFGWRARRQGRTDFGLRLRDGGLAELGTGLAWGLGLFVVMVGLALATGVVSLDGTTGAWWPSVGIAIYFAVLFWLEEIAFRGVFLTGLGVVAGVVPAVVIFFGLHTIPVVTGMFFSLTNYAGYGTWSFVGLSNYLNLFRDDRVIASYLFTFGFSLVTVVAVNIIALLLAVALTSRIRLKTPLRTIFVIPMVISAIIAHSERHRGEREQPAPCTGPKCPPQSSAPPRP